MIKTHPCLMCCFREVALARPLCWECFDLVPWELRAKVVRAWYARVVHPSRAQECIAELKQWQAQSFRGGRHERTQ